MHFHGMVLLHLCDNFHLVVLGDLHVPHGYGDFPSALGFFAGWSHLSGHVLESYLYIEHLYIEINDGGRDEHK